MYKFTLLSPEKEELKLQIVITAAESPQPAATNSQIQGAVIKSQSQKKADTADILCSPYAVYYSQSRDNKENHAISIIAFEADTLLRPPSQIARVDTIPQQLINNPSVETDDIEIRTVTAPGQDDDSAFIFQTASLCPVSAKYSEKTLERANALLKVDPDTNHANQVPTEQGTDIAGEYLFQTASMRSANGNHTKEALDRARMILTESEPNNNANFTAVQPKEMEEGTSVFMFQTAGMKPSEVSYSAASGEKARQILKESPALLSNDQTTTGTLPDVISSLGWQIPSSKIDNGHVRILPLPAKRAHTEAAMDSLVRSPVSDRTQKRDKKTVAKVFHAMARQSYIVADETEDTSPKKHKRLKLEAGKPSKAFSLQKMLPFGAEQLEEDDIPPAIVKISPQNSCQFAFEENGKRYDQNYFMKEFIHVPYERNWVQNHWRWIVWKLASYARLGTDWPCLTQALCYANISAQLQMRYDIECVQKLLSPLLHLRTHKLTYIMGLTVCVASITTRCNQVSVEITDGWHAMTVSLDPLLCRLAHTKGIFVGMKLHISILQQDYKSSEFTLAYNACRKAVWYSKLGQTQRYRIPMPLSMIRSLGGIVHLIDVVIERMYPPKFVERCKNGRSIYRTQQQEAARRQKLQGEAYQRFVEMAEANAAKYASGQSTGERQVFDESTRFMEDISSDVSTCYKMRVLDYMNMECMILCIFDPKIGRNCVEGGRIKLSNLTVRSVYGPGDQEIQLTTTRSSRSKLSDVCNEQKAKFDEHLAFYNHRPLHISKEVDVVGIIIEIVADDKGTLLYCTSESSDIFTVQMCPDAPKVSEQHLLSIKYFKDLLRIDISEASMTNGFKWTENSSVCTDATNALVYDYIKSLTVWMEQNQPTLKELAQNAHALSQDSN